MKKIISVIAIAVLAMSMLVMVSCNRTPLAADCSNEKDVVITADRADADDFIVTGTLEVGEGEQVTIESKLSSGKIELQLISAEGMDNPEELPDTEGAEPTYTAYLDGEGTQTVSFGAGSFMIKPVVTEKATGTIELIVTPVEGPAEE
jgi:hypothetical protein